MYIYITVFACCRPLLPSLARSLSLRPSPLPPSLPPSLPPCLPSLLPLPPLSLSVCSNCRKCFIESLQ